MVLTRTDIDDMKRAVKSEIDRIFNAEFKNQVVETIMNKIEERFENRIKKLESDMTALNNRITDLSIDNRNMRTKLDALEQHTRRQNIRIFGLQYQDGENTLEKVIELFHSKLKLNSVRSGDIKSCYRVAAKNTQPEKPPAVLVSFSDNNIRASVLKSRKELRSTKIFVREDLTNSRVKLLSAAINKFSRKDAWCRNGVVYVRSGGVTHRVEDIKYLDQI